MSDTSSETLDPRIRRTRLMLQQALGKLLETKEFENISVQDITEAATLNRATFYDHYADKFALLECMVGSRFHELLAERGVTFDGQCSSALKAVVLGVCDYLASMPRVDCERQRQMEPHMESAVIAVVRRMILYGLKQHAAENAVSPEIIAATVSWAIYGAAKEWVRTPNRCSSETIVETIQALVSPIFTTVQTLETGATVG
jgi:AcrR family transcriptional regulator